MGVSDAVSGAIKTVEKLNPLGGDDQQDEQRDEQRTAEQAPGSEEARSGQRPGEDTEQVRVERAEEELEVKKTQRETGSVGVHKSVETENVDVAVPVRREQARVERVPVDEPTESAAIGEEVIRVPVYEEETVVTKQPVVKEEIRVTKEAHGDVEHVAENVRKENVDVDAPTQKS
jgi:uncharacterized protein (TIGR02271 family)